MAEAKTPQPKPEPARRAPLAPASTSGDPAVHKLLADLQSARLNGDGEAMTAVTASLAELGYE